MGYLGSLKEETWIKENIEYTVHTVDVLLSVWY